MNKSAMNPKHHYLFMSTLMGLVALLSLSGCGTFEVGMEQGITPAITVTTGAAAAGPTPNRPQTAVAPQAGSDDETLSEPALNPIPGLQVIAINWSGEMKGTCQSLMINYGGEAAIGPCKQSFRDMQPLDGRFEHGQWWDYWIERFAPFHSENLAPLGQINVQGLGHEMASAAWQRAAARWAELLWVEMETDGHSESWTTALSWQQGMPDRPTDCGSLQVSVYGTAQASYGPCDSEAPATQVEAWLASDEWEPFDAWYVSKQPWSDDSLDFYGSGPLEMSAAESQELHRWAEALFNRLILGELMGSGSQQAQSMPPPSTTVIPETAIASTPAPDTAVSPLPPTPTSVDVESTDLPMPLIWQERPPGLVYRTLEALWQIDANEQPLALGGSEDVLSPDGRQLLSYDRAVSTIWLQDLRGGPDRSFPVDAGRQLCCLQWWPGQLEQIVYNAVAADAESRPGMMGYLVISDLGGRIQAEWELAFDTGRLVFALAPDGQRIAYRSGETAWIHHPDTGAEIVEPAAYGLPGGIQLANPAWSPDGSQLAWRANGELLGDGRFLSAIAVIDLINHGGRLLHLYEPMGRGGWPEAVRWSPDGEWLAFSAGPVNLEEAGVWVIPADGVQTNEFYFGPGGTPVWSPDGGWLALGHINEAGVPEALAVETGTWQQRPIDLPPGTYYFVDWIQIAAVSE